MITMSLLLKLPGHSILSHESVFHFLKPLCLQEARPGMISSCEGSVPG